MDFLIFVVGIGLGIIFSIIVSLHESVGTIRVDNSDSDGPYLFLELNRGVSDVYRKKFVVLRVNVKDYISHK